MLFQSTTRRSIASIARCFFEPHQLRFQPRNDAAQRVLHYELTIDPEPAGMTTSLDADGNLVTQAWFEGRPRADDDPRHL